MSGLPPTVLVDADAFFSYLKGDNLSSHVEKLISKADRGETKLCVSSEIYDDITSALRSDNIPLNLVVNFIEDMKLIPHHPLPMTAEIAHEALRLYRLHRGSRKLHYFDAYHVASAKLYNLPFITSDKYVLEHQNELGIASIDLASL
ncbi:MAG: PIN domain protein [Candidatus Bathyarchaeota archaeon BA1]|nr:MAG: PIN domain protein [Candidatus Bathyarchaeota archaeon BA1]